MYEKIYARSLHVSCPCFNMLYFGFYPPHSAYAIGGGGISTVTGGAVNCKAENTYIQNIGDTAHVSYKIQTSAFLLSAIVFKVFQKHQFLHPRFLKMLNLPL